MKFIVFSLAFASLTGLASFAQDRPPGPPPGDFKPPKEFQEKIDAVKKACENEIAQYCADEHGPRQIFCLRKHLDSGDVKKESKCAKALDALPKPPHPPKDGRRRPRPPQNDDGSPQSFVPTTNDSESGAAPATSVR